MGSSSSKRSSLEQRLAGQYSCQESILAAIAANNKQQRRLLLKHAKRQLAQRDHRLANGELAAKRYQWPLYYSTDCYLSGLDCSSYPGPAGDHHHDRHYQQQQEERQNLICGKLDPSPPAGSSSSPTSTYETQPVGGSGSGGGGQGQGRPRGRARIMHANSCQNIYSDSPSGTHSSGSFLNHPIYLPPQPSAAATTYLRLGPDADLDSLEQLELDEHLENMDPALLDPAAFMNGPPKRRRRRRLAARQGGLPVEPLQMLHAAGASRAATTKLHHLRHQQYPHSLARDSQNIITTGINSSTSKLDVQQTSKRVKASDWEMSSHLIPTQCQRGLAFTEEERKRYRLLGHLPAAYQDQELQVRAVIEFLDTVCNKDDQLAKYIYLRNLKDFNERLFYAAVQKHVEKLMPIVYTPTVGLACQSFSRIYLKPRGLFVSARDLGRVSSLLDNWQEPDVRVIVVTDGERILGLGDLGANGMGISIGKLSLYTALAGIPPRNVLPVCIDVGTQNEKNLEDPFYIGLRQPRIRGAQYQALIDEFMRSVVDRWGRSCLIQFEDFANSTAFDLLLKYRDQYCTFNDDIQGTASVCLAGLIAATRLTGQRLRDCSFLFYGAGEANLGTAKLLTMAIVEAGGVSEIEASSRIWLIDSKGLIVSDRKDLSEHKRQFAKSAPHLRDLEQIIEHIRPAAIIGACAQPGAFTEPVCAKMAQINKRPIIFALSNPTSCAECTAEQAYKWTKGTCVFASGSPFEPVEYMGKTYITGQGNNVYVFPGVGLAAIAAHVHSIPEETFLVAAKALADQVSPEDTEIGLIYPRLTRVREVTLKLAARVFEYFYTERLANYRPEPNDKMDFLRSIQYDTRYPASASVEHDALAESMSRLAAQPNHQNP